MTFKHALGLSAAILVATASRLPAQDSAAVLLQHAISLYEQVEVEDAVAILRQLVAPSPSLAVSAEQQAQAYKYLGAAFALEPGADKRDSAIAFFGAAIKRDPMVDLDAQSFTPIQVAAFAEARNRTFAVAVQSLRPDTLDSTATFAFHCLTSQPATLHAELRSGGVVLALYDGQDIGRQDVPWDGKLPGDSLAVPRRYELAVVGHSGTGDLTDSVNVWFEVQLDHAPLEDTVADLGPQDLLPDSDANHQEIPANVQENQRRQADRATFNAGVAERNAEAVRRSRWFVVPLAGEGS